MIQPPINYSLPEISQTETCCNNYGIDDVEDENTTFKIDVSIFASYNFNAIKNKISQISMLSQDWDGYNAVIPSNEVIKNAYKFIDNAFHNNYSFIEADDVTPTPYGTIVFDFINKRGLVSVEIGKKAIGFFTDFANITNHSSDGIDSDFKLIPEELNQSLLELDKWSGIY